MYESFHNTQPGESSFTSTQSLMEPDDPHETAQRSRALHTHNKIKSMNSASFHSGRLASLSEASF